MNSIPTENHGHFPVMLSETINNLNILETGFYIDGTVAVSYTHLTLPTNREV